MTKVWVRRYESKIASNWAWAVKSTQKAKLRKDKIDWSKGNNHESLRWLW